MNPLRTAPELPLDVLIVAPHPDDAELGMGGAIVKMISEGWRVGVLDLTSGEPTPYGSLERRQQETSAASQVLGLSWRHNAGLVNRALEATLEARGLVAGIIRQTRPRWLFAPYWEDAHPDHLAATQIVEAARFWAKLSNTDLPGEPHHPERIFHYYCIHLRAAITPDFILDISDQWETKLESIRCFESQFITGRPTEPPTLIDRFRDDAAYWGRLINRRYGEPYAAREPVAMTSFGALI
ncbi:bacillithiol biosynthesis deacetylase BshB1 [Candidatus Laterigemmans baculatus]|uniref:bacillithiol biosynthesis deacetylase BshB1 n=1 Tax=Candidatus Laterigemmans baculatus TaxID=2770505 RepID=UPI0013DD30FF|nr:bacillithiol biosynthesis deacetylase BshB1 [Candidatus Laterigemmans baculatus]